MIACWPGRIKAGAVSDQVWAFWDFLPTVADLAGAKPPEKLDGISIAPALLGEKQAGRAQQNHDFLYWEFHEGGFSQAVRMGDWKLVRRPYGKDPAAELYNLKSDVGEAKNVAGEYKDVVAKIETYLKDARTDAKQWPVPPRTPQP
jgi:arylsulfatase A-like enzyme